MFSSCNHSILLSALILSILTTLVHGEICIVPHDAPNGDDTPAVLAAFQRCGRNGKIKFEESKVYNINQVMNTTNLFNCEIDLKGTLLVHLSMN
jgi:galacturan 1,4-alpha-galacturonidase